MRWTLLWSWCAVLAVAAAVVVSVMTLHGARPTADVLVLRNGWFAPVTDFDPPPPELYRVAVSLPDDWRSREPAVDSGWYRLDLDLEVAPNRLWGIYIPSLEMTPLVYLNGVLIGGTEISQPLHRYWNRPLYFRVPSGVLSPGSNRIEIRLAANGHWGRLSEIYFGPDQTLRPHYQRRYDLRVSSLQVTTILGLAVSLFIAALYLASRDTTYGWFSLFAAGWTLQNYFVITVELPFPNDYWDLFVNAVLSFMLVSGSIFTFRFLGIRRVLWERMLVATALAGPIVLLLILVTNQTLFSAASTLVWFGILLALMIFPFWLMARAVATLRDLEVVALTCCYSVIVALTVHDWTVVTGLGDRHEGLMMQFAAGPTFATFGVILVRRFVVALREGENFRQNLEIMVEAKSREVEAAHQHTHELELQQTLLAERARLMRDMHDGIGSQLIGVVSRLSPDDDREREIIHELRRALDDLRMMIDSLDDVDDDLVSVLGLFRHRIQPQLDDAGLRLHWKMSDLPPIARLGPERVLHFLRMLQEAVTNVIKHANATQIWIRTLPEVFMDGRRCVGVEVEDDGCGLPTDLTEGRGFRNMRHRARLADLCISIEVTACGTRVRLAVPEAPVAAARGATTIPSFSDADARPIA